SMTNWNPRQLEIPLDFLGAGSYIAEIYKDEQDSDRHPKHILIENETVSKGQYLNIKLSEAGGCAIRFRPEE
ncbi:MAG: glycoside hydrolase family 97 C-terminal domain-containing protein, partial [Bacteroidales bacterium]|nr:glycoside hydrolase family 97 C-terminal domain-containing protein [Bacteroidales bacterium]